MLSRRARLHLILNHELRDSDKHAGKIWTETLDLLFRRYPSHRNLLEVEGKIGVLDSLYLTQLRYGDRRGEGADGSAVRILARWMVSERGRLEKYLRTGDERAVYMLEGEHPLRTKLGNVRYLSSFATKYAHFHNPLAFPIYDSRAYNSIVKISKLVALRHTIAELNRGDWYAAWRDYVRDVQGLMGAHTLREVDGALYWWNGGEG